MKALREEIYGKSTQAFARNMLKSTFSGLQHCRWRHGSIFIGLAVVACLPNLRNPAKFTENSNLCSSRSSSHRSWCQSKAHMQIPTL